MISQNNDRRQESLLEQGTSGETQPFSSAWDNGFTRVSNSLLHHAPVSDAAMMTYLAIASFDWSGRGCFPGIDLIATVRGKKRSTILEHIRVLEACGLISTHRRGFGHTNRYIRNRDEVQKAGHVQKIRHVQLSGLSDNTDHGSPAFTPGDVQLSGHKVNKEEDEEEEDKGKAHGAAARAPHGDMADTTLTSDHEGRGDRGVDDEDSVAFFERVAAEADRLEAATRTAGPVSPNPLDSSPDSPATRKPRAAKAVTAAKTAKTAKAAMEPASGVTTAQRKAAAAAGKGESTIRASVTLTSADGTLYYRLAVRTGAHLGYDVEAYPTVLARLCRDYKRLEKAYPDLAEEDWTALLGYVMSDGWWGDHAASFGAFKALDTALPVWLRDGKPPIKGARGAAGTSGRSSSNGAGPKVGAPPLVAAAPPVAPVPPVPPVPPVIPVTSPSQADPAAAAEETPSAPGTRMTEWCLVCRMLGGYPHNPECNYHGIVRGIVPPASGGISLDLQARFKRAGITRAMLLAQGCDVPWEPERKSAACR